MSDNISSVETNIDSIDKKSEKENNEDPKNEEPADYETAIKAAGFGKFNIFLLMISTTAGLATVFESTTMSYVFPAAQCDLNLSLKHKGVLNAVTYSGMVATSVIWGFLCDTFGRKKLLVVGYYLDAMLCILAATSQSFHVLALSKFLGGAVINGPFSALSSYLSETHSSKNRARTQLFIGYAMSLGTVILPVLALHVLPTELYIEIGTYLVLRSWNVFLLICALPAVISGTAFIFFPESPKFLMTAGRNKEALDIFKNIYRMNTGKARETYPIKELIIENTSEENGSKDGLVNTKRSNIQALKEGFHQIKPIFMPPHILHVLLVITTQNLIMMGTNSVRLWLPQLFQAVVDYEHFNNKTDVLCVVIDSFAERHENKTHECVVNFDNVEVYVNSIIVAIATVAAYVTAGFVINCLGKKTLLHAIGLLTSAMAVALCFSVNNAMTVSLLSIEIGFGTVATNVILAVVVDLFPTTLRSMAVALTMMFGRLGGATGNLVFPYLLTYGCVPSFVTIAVILAVCGLMAFFFPKTDQKALK